MSKDDDFHIPPENIHFYEPSPEERAIMEAHLIRDVHPKQSLTEILKGYPESTLVGSVERPSFGSLDQFKRKFVSFEIGIAGRDDPPLKPVFARGKTLDQFFKQR